MAFWDPFADSILFASMLMPYSDHDLCGLCEPFFDRVNKAWVS